MTRKLNLLKIEQGLVYYTNEDNDCVLKDSPRNIINRGVVRLFGSKEDRDYIYAMSSMSKLDIKWYGFLTALYVSALLIAIPMSPHSVTVFGSTQPGGILIFPITFLILDTINTTLRYEYAKTTAYIGSGICIMASLLIAVTFYSFNISGSYKEVFHPLIKLYLINSLCIIMSDQTNNFIFKILSERLYSVSIWKRSIVSSVVGQIIYTIVWITLFFNSLPSKELVEKILDNYFFKICYAFAIIPIIYFLVWLYNFLRGRCTLTE